MNEKTCTKCGETFPKTKDYYRITIRSGAPVYSKNAISPLDISSSMVLKKRNALRVMNTNQRQKNIFIEMWDKLLVFTLRVKPVKH